MGVYSCHGEGWDGVSAASDFATAFRLYRIANADVLLLPSADGATPETVLAWWRQLVVAEDRLYASVACPSEELLQMLAAMNKCEYWYRRAASIVRMRGLRQTAILTTQV